MELRQAILNNIAKEHKEEAISMSDLEKLFDKECYVVLEEIKTVLEDDSLNDKDCFEKIEKIVCLFEKMGSDCGSRHDFG